MFRKFLILIICYQTAAASEVDSSWSLQYHRVENGPEGDLVVRVGDVDNLGFGWGEENLNPFTGVETPVHPFPWEADPADHPGTDRIMLGSSVVFPRPDGVYGDGYSDTSRPENEVRPVEIDLGELPSEIKNVLIQMFVDDFQAPNFGSEFQVTLNGKRLSRAERIINHLEQTGPVGKLITFRLDPSEFELFEDGKISLKIDDPTTGARDGYALDFVRVLINPKILYPVDVMVNVVNRDTGEPIEGAAVSSSISDGVSDALGQVLLTQVPAGLLAIEAEKTGYRAGLALLDVSWEDKRGEVTIGLEPMIPGRLSVTLAENSPAAEPGAALIIFDASGSMLQRMGDGKRRIEVARETFATVVREVLPDSLDTGLRVFGEGGPGSCESVLKLPVGALDRAAMEQAITSIRPVNLSKTPIAASLLAAKDDLAEIRGPKLVLLLTDGEETCGGDPEQAMTSLREAGLDVRINIVGFALDDQELKESFEKLAAIGGGTYFDANHKDELEQAVRSAFAIPYEVRDGAGNQVAQGHIGGEEIELPEGDYTVSTPHGGGLKADVRVPNASAVSVVLGETP